MDDLPAYFYIELVSAHGLGHRMAPEPVSECEVDGIERWTCRQCARALLDSGQDCVYGEAAHDLCNGQALPVHVIVVGGTRQECAKWAANVGRPMAWLRVPSRQAFTVYKQGETVPANVIDTGTSARDTGTQSAFRMAEGLGHDLVRNPVIAERPIQRWSCQRCAHNLLQDRFGRIFGDAVSLSCGLETTIPPSLLIGGRLAETQRLADRLDIGSQWRWLPKIQTLSAYVLQT